MHHLFYAAIPPTKTPICFLVQTIRKQEIEDAYITPFGVNPDEVMVLDLYQNQKKKKTPVAEIKAYIKEMVAPTLEDMGVEYIVCSDSEYFKVLTKVTKVDPNLGYVLPCVFGGYKVVYVPSFRAIFYDPEKIKAKIEQGMQALVAHRSSSYEEPGNGIIKFALYPKGVHEIKKALDTLLGMNMPLAIDIEAFSLKHPTAGIGTISFCWSKTEGIAFAVDYEEIEGAVTAPFGRQVFNGSVRKLLKEFFQKYTERALYHNISYDVYVLIYQLFMHDLLDTDGLLTGIDVMLRNWDDTKLITYLATNSCAGNKLSLKDQAQEYAGNYAMEDIVDIAKIPLNKLLKYNLIDGLCTWHTYEKHWDTLVADDQLDIYQNLFKPAILDIIQMQLTGMPLNMGRVLEVEVELQHDNDVAIAAMQSTNTVQRFTYRMREKIVEKRNAKYVKKRITVADVTDEFNPNSNLQLQDLLYEMLGLPVISLTDSKQPSCDGDTIKALRNHTADSDVLRFLNALMDYTAVNKILTSFIPAMKGATLGPDGWHYLFGNFNLGGTLSGRLSSSDPNLQNLPANSVYAKKIKSCFQAPPGWLFCGLDFASLEDRISALTTKDPNKLKVYTDGYDGHSLRAFAYFGEQMPTIVNTVASINSIQTAYKDFRQESKAPTFALTYQGTYITLMKNCGFTMERAKLVERRYHELYAVSDAWVQDKLDKAAQVGYITAAFGLRLRTPLLHQVVRGNSRTPYEAEAEGRTAGNALGQSWCLLNSRASAEFMSGVRKSKFRLAIRPCAHIHDAQYMLIRDDINAVMYTNKHLVAAVEWQAHPEIAHPDVKLGGELSIFFPSWLKEIGIPKGATSDEVFAVIDQAMT